MNFFKSFIAPAILSLVSLSAGVAHATTWDLDEPHTTVGFKVRHAIVSNVDGAFTKFKGTATVDDKNITKSSIEVVIDVGSIDTRSEKRDQHLKGPDFFDAEKYPTITFKSTKVQKLGKKLKVTGMLTMHGIEKQVVLLTDMPAKPVKDPFGMIRSGISASTKLSRKEYGLQWNKALEAGGALVGDEITINIDAEFVQQVPTVTPSGAAGEMPAPTTDKPSPAGKPSPTQP